MRLVILINETFEEEKALMNLENDQVYAKGDGSQEDIDMYIAGIIEGFVILGEEVELIERGCRPGDYLFRLCAFLDEEAK